MLIPQFTLSQTKDFIIAEIIAPYVKAKEVEWTIEGAKFEFHVKPYFLRLTFNNNICEDGTEEAKYDIDAGKFTVKIPKEVKGQEFEDLDMITRVLSPEKGKTKEHRPPLIEVIGESPKNNESGEALSTAGLLDKVVPEEEDPSTVEPMLATVHYGFNNAYTDILGKLMNEISDCVDVPDPEHMTAEERREMRLQQELEKFDEDHYMADIANYDDEVRPLLQYECWWEPLYRMKEKERVAAHDDDQVDRECYHPRCQQRAGQVCYSSMCNNNNNSNNVISATRKCYATICANRTRLPCSSYMCRKRWSSAAPSLSLSSSDFTFSKDEQEAMRRLPRKEYLINSPLKIYLGLVDIIFAYAYDHRTTTGDATVESPWTVTKISATLSWLEEFQTLESVVQSVARRCLCFPLVRSWPLLEKVLVDLKQIFALGRRSLLRALLMIHASIQRDEAKYAANILYITDYCVFVQTCLAADLCTVSNQLNNICLRKDDYPEFQLEAWEFLLAENDDNEDLGSDDEDEDEETSSESEYASTTDSDDGSQDSDDYP